MLYSQNEPHVLTMGFQEIMRQFCAALPADRLLQGNKATLENALRKEKLLRKYIDRDSGATLTYESSLVVLSHFLGCLVQIFTQPCQMSC